MFNVQMTTSGPHGSTLTTLEAVETTSSWMPFVSTTVPECVRPLKQSKQEPQTGSRREKRVKLSTQTQLWDSGASTRNKFLDATAPITPFVFFVLKVWMKAYFLFITQCGAFTVFDQTCVTSRGVTRHILGGQPPLNQFGVFCSFSFCFTKILYNVTRIHF